MCIHRLLVILVPLSSCHISPAAPRLLAHPCQSVRRSASPSPDLPAHLPGLHRLRPAPLVSSSTSTPCADRSCQSRVRRSDPDARYVLSCTVLLLLSVALLVLLHHAPATARSEYRRGVGKWCAGVSSIRDKRQAVHPCTSIIVHICDCVAAA